MNKEKTRQISLQKEIKKLLEKGLIEGVFPAAAAGISFGLGSEKKESISFCGNAALFPEKRIMREKYFFDLASLTKPLAASLALLCLLKDKKIELDEQMSSLLEKKIAGKKGEITVRQLLNHCSGLPAHRDYYTILKKIPENEKSEIVENLILGEVLESEPGSTALYSDLGFILLGRIIEKRSGCSLAHFVEEKIFKPLNVEKNIFYNPVSHGIKSYNKTDFVATEKCSRRNKIICGEVHDDNCYAMGGVAGHSGLFGNIEGVTTLTGKLLDIWKGVTTHPHINREDLEGFLTRQKKIPGSTWALGFDTPSSEGSSSGSHLFRQSVGHLGFTGTSFWIDPDKDIVIVLLTNRVHPSRENRKIRQFRPEFHDLVIKKLFSI